MLLGHHSQKSDHEINLSTYQSINPLESGKLTEGHTLKGNCHSLSSYQLPIDHLVGMGILAHLFHLCCVFVIPGLAQLLCMLSQALWVHMCSYPMVSRQQYFLKFLYHFWLLNFFFPLFHSDPERKACNVNVFFGAEHSSVSFSTFWPIVGLYFTIYCKKTFICERSEIH